jgi:hypothetical protein
VRELERRLDGAGEGFGQCRAVQTGLEARSRRGSVRRVRG